MNAREFYETVRRMRKAQREYFRTKTSKALQESMELEGLSMQRSIGWRRFYGNVGNQEYSVNHL